MKRLLILLSFCLFATAAAAEDDELIHSDLPLWTHDEKRIWPRHFVDRDSFGCMHRMKLGDWRLDQNDDPLRGAWIRLSNYGVMHCFIVERRADDQAALEHAEHDYSVLVHLGRARGRGGGVELWALQSGARPGSDYLLLASKPGDGTITQFDVLRRRCARGAMRQGPPIDILLTRYCAINAQQELVTMARRMADLPPLGRLTFVAREPERDE